MRRPPTFPPRTSCMGGWCGLRETCRHYLTTFRSTPHERLCDPGCHDFYAAAELAPLPHPAPVILLTKAAPTAA